ncbi:MAG: carboxypeptidase-like regulatory domain-containing protein [Tannerellaceae bacterium]|jgi:hypothetical protein|nr:carboxypeptidase-like regulatory domain-containing protein [Tannerellaceae bacterium]
MRKCKLLLLVSVIFSSLLSVTGQNLNRIKGRVTDKSTDMGISNINIFVEDTRIGTVSNQAGEFSIQIPATYANRSLYFSGVGYGKDSLRIKDIQFPFNVRLSPETYSLKEVYVIPDSTLFTLLRKAYNKIPGNYPTEPSLYEGFYRESLQNENKEQIDFIEAVLSVYKDPYNNPSNEPGQIEVLQSRKRRAQNISAVYYAGAFIPIDMDYVLKHAEFISPRHFNKYNYEFNGIKTVGSKEFYDISFEVANRNTSHLKGSMLIEKESLAYVSFDMENDKVPRFEPRIKDRSFHVKSTYEKQNGKWYFKRGLYSGKHTDKFTNEVRFGTLEYITTNIITDSVKPVPYEKRLGYTEPLILKTQEYDSEGWTDYAILQNEAKGQTNFQFSIDESAAIFSENKSASANEPALMKVVNILPYIQKIYYSVGISYCPFTVNPSGNHIIFHPSTAHLPFVINKSQAQKKEQFRGQIRLGYRLSKNSGIFFQASPDLFNKSISSEENVYGVDFRKNISPTGRPLFVHASLALTFHSYYADLGKYDNPSSFTCQGKEIDANKISFGYGMKQTTLSPQLAVVKNISQSLGLKLYIAYHIPLQTKNIFRVKEEKGGLFSKKTITINAEDPALSFSSDKNIWNTLSISKWEAGVAFVFN